MANFNLPKINGVTTGTSSILSSEEMTHLKEFYASLTNRDNIPVDIPVNEEILYRLYLNNVKTRNELIPNIIDIDVDGVIGKYYDLDEIKKGELTVFIPLDETVGMLFNGITYPPNNYKVNDYNVASKAGTDLVVTSIKSNDDVVYDSDEVHSNSVVGDRISPMVLESTSGKTIFFKSSDKPIILYGRLVIVDSVNVQHIATCVITRQESIIEVMLDNNALSYMENVYLDFISNSNGDELFLDIIGTHITATLYIDVGNDLLDSGKAIIQDKSNDWMYSKSVLIKPLAATMGSSFIYNGKAIEIDDFTPSIFTNTNFGKGKMGESQHTVEYIDGSNYLWNRFIGRNTIIENRISLTPNSNIEYRISHDLGGTYTDWVSSSNSNKDYSNITGEHNLSLSNVNEEIVSYNEYLNDYISVLDSKRETSSTEYMETKHLDLLNIDTSSIGDNSIPTLKDILLGTINKFNVSTILKKLLNKEEYNDKEYGLYAPTTTIDNASLGTNYMNNKVMNDIEEMNGFLYKSPDWEIASLNDAGNYVVTKDESYCISDALVKVTNPDKKIYGGTYDYGIVKKIYNNDGEDLIVDYPELHNRVVDVNYDSDSRISSNVDFELYSTSDNGTDVDIADYPIWGDYSYVDNILSDDKHIPIYIENAKLIKLSKSTIIWNKDRIIIVGDISNNLLGLNVKSSIVEIDAVNSIVDVWCNGDILLYIDNGEVRYVTSDDIYNLKQSSINNPLSIPLVLKPYSFVKNTGLPIINTKQGEQFIVGHTVNCTAGLNNFYIDNQIPQLANNGNKLS